KIQSLRLGVEPTTERFLDLALALHAAELSEEAMGDAAALLGVDVEELSAIVESAGRTLEDFVDTAAGQLPTLSDAFKTSGDNVDLTIAGFIQNLTEATTAMEVFRTDLQVITEAGFADLAALIAEQGP